MTSTQQNEAMQAVRLLFDMALSGDKEPKTQAQVETLYQARRVIEGFIVDAGVLESTAVAKEPTSTTFNGATFRVGEFILVEGPDGIRAEQIDKVSPIHDFIEHSSNGWHHSRPISDIIDLNPNGSRE